VHVRIRLADIIVSFSRVKRAVGRAEAGIYLAAQRQCAFLEFIARVESLRGSGPPKQGKRLIVEHRTLIEDGSIGRDQGAEQAVAAAIVRREVLRAAAQNTVNVAAPSECTGLPECVYLARMNPRSARIAKREAILPERFDEPAILGVDAVRPPPWIRIVHQPSGQLRMQCPEFRHEVKLSAMCQPSVPRCKDCGQPARHDAP
jgi:hypothetical protein